AIELTRDFQLLPFLMLGSVCAMTVTVLLMKRSILTEKLARRGQHITREYAIDYFELMRVADVMDKNPPVISSEVTVHELARRIASGDADLCRRQGTLLMDANHRLVGIITRGDLVKALQENRRHAPIREIARAELIVGYPDESLQTALERMLQNGVGRLPIVGRDRPDELVGYLGRAAILSARMKLYQEEKIREPGWLSTALKRSAPRSQNSPI
ncbi:MAG TPA: CBS domain-containing protein, partial [Verrucomicrobiae bacterium]|nr:CBS domain-containing protein [Verrucomicrobiae bacterium]